MRVCRILRKFTESLPSTQIGAAYPTNILEARNAIDAYNEKGDIVSRSYLVLKEE